MTSLLKQLQAMAKGITGVKAENSDDQKLVDDLAAAAATKAEEDVQAEADEADTAAGKLTADMVKNTVFKAYQKQVNAFIETMTIHAEEQENAVQALVEDMPKRVDAALNTLLAKVTSQSKTPAASNSFTSKVENTKEVEFDKIEAKKKEIQNRVKTAKS